MEDVGVLRLEPPALAKAAGGIRDHPPNVPVRECPADHRLGHRHLGLKGDCVLNAGPPAPVAVVRPGRGQIQAAVDRRPAAGVA